MSYLLDKLAFGRTTCHWIVYKWLLKQTCGRFRYTTRNHKCLLINGTINPHQQVWLSHLKVTFEWLWYAVSTFMQMFTHKDKHSPSFHIQSLLLALFNCNEHQSRKSGFLSQGFKQSSSVINSQIGLLKQAAHNNRLTVTSPLRNAIMRAENSGSVWTDMTGTAETKLILSSFFICPKKRKL